MNDQHVSNNTVNAGTEARGRTGTGESESIDVVFTLYDAIERMSTADTREVIVDIALDAAVDVLGLAQTGVHFHDDDDRVLAPFDWSGTLSEELGEPPDLGPDSMAWSVFESGQLNRVDDYWSKDGGIHNPDTPFRSEIIAPLGEYGVVLTASPEPNEFDDSDQRFIDLLCSNLTNELDRIQREKHLRQREQQIDHQRQLLDQMKKISNADTQEAVVDIALDTAVDVLGLAQTGVHFHDEDERVLAPFDWSGTLSEELGEPPDLGPDSTAWSVFESGQLLRVDDYWSKDGEIHNPDTPFRSEIIAPLGEYGALLTASPEPNEFDDADQRFIDLLCSNLTNELDRIQQQQYLQEREQQIDHQQQLLSQLTDTVEGTISELSTVSEDVSTSSQEIRQSVDQQTETVGTIANEISDLSATVEEVASTANQVETTTEAAREQTTDGTEAATQALGVMEDVSESADAVASDVDTLQQRVKDIDEIVEVINDIAEQTNLLALNASIEAARAGEAGDGFAVVADEVKNLAEESKQQAGRIEEMVDEIQTETNETVSNLNETTDQIDRGTEAMESTMDTFEEIEAAVKEVAIGVEQVADVTSEQATSAEKIAATVDEATEQADRVATEIDDIVGVNEKQVRMVNELKDTLERVQTEVTDG